MAGGKNIFTTSAIWDGLSGCVDLVEVGFGIVSCGRVRKAKDEEVCVCDNPRQAASVRAAG